MKILAALVLVFLGVITFPFDPRILFSAPGLFLATIGLAFWFFAYRVATHKRKDS